MSHSPIFVALLLASVGCDDGESESATPSPEAPTAQVAAGSTTPDESPPEAPADPIEEEAPVMDLLHAVPAIIGVSSVYEGDREQVERLFDGDLETTWNSESEALAGAFIEVQVPDDAEISAIEMTAGYTKNARGRDLFTMNHRVARVRVMRGTAQLAEQALDIDNRALQSIAFEATGGKLRIELAELTEGSNAEWREVCVSELRVMGRAPSATADSVSPEVEIGPIGGYDLQTAKERLDALTPADADPQESPEGVALAASHDYARAWFRDIFAACPMPRLEEGWTGIERRRRHAIGELATLQRRIAGLETKVEAGEASAGEERRLARLLERIGGFETAIDHTLTQAVSILEQVDEYMCAEGSEITRDFDEPAY